MGWLAIAVAPATTDPGLFLPSGTQTQFEEISDDLLKPLVP
jgi:hypothetical protein